MSADTSMPDTIFTYTSLILYIPISSIVLIPPNTSLVGLCNAHRQESVDEKKIYANVM